MHILVPPASRDAQDTGASSRILAKAGYLLRYFFREWDFFAILAVANATRSVAL